MESRSLRECKSENDYSKPKSTFDSVRAKTLQKIRSNCDKEEESAETTGDNKEQFIGEIWKHEFQAETVELLKIVAKSMHTENEIFIRELISNASNALEKLRYTRLTRSHDGKERHPLEIHIKTDKYSNMFTIQDSGVGMSKDELNRSLGTISRSGSKEFLKNMSEKGDLVVRSIIGQSIIGQFGIGFHSTFLVGNVVKVFTKSHEAGSQAYSWTWTGGSSYVITEAESVAPGTKIIIKLKPDFRKFADEEIVKLIVRKHSTFVGFPVRLNGKLLNTNQPLWTLEERDITEEQHLNFFRHLSGSEEESYMYKLFYRISTPLNIRSIFYISEQRPTLLEATRDSSGISGVSLYCRKVLIQTKTKHILPKWLRFVRGVIDSEDVELSARHDSAQSGVISQLKEIISGRMLQFFLDQSIEDPKKYMRFYASYKMFITEGVLEVDTAEDKERVAQLLRYESSILPEGELTSMKNYSARMLDDQIHIYYICAPSRALAVASPYFEALNEKNFEVLFCYDPYDEVTMLQLKNFDKKPILSAKNEALESLFQPIDRATGKVIGADDQQLSCAVREMLVAWAKRALGTRVADVKVTSKADKPPALIIFPKGASEQENILHMKPTLQLNSRHSVVMKLVKLKDEDDDLAKWILEQLHDNAMISAGMGGRPAMAGQMNDLLSKLVDSR